jgi:hypothetical protein
MRKAASLVLAMLFVFSVPTAWCAQDEPESQKIIVRSRDINNGVVILTVQQARNSFELQCNKGNSGCTVLDPGEYMMVRLPKNHGMYDCTNAEVYQKSANSEVGDQLGQYCVVESK